MKQEPKIKNIYVSAKCSDNCFVSITDENGDELTPPKFDYVPKFLDVTEPEDSGCGDYVILNIDFETGKIKNWNKYKKFVKEYVENGGKIFNT